MVITSHADAAAARETDSFDLNRVALSAEAGPQQAAVASNLRRLWQWATPSQ